MPVYEDKAPGVYIETVLTPPAISGVSTSITAFLGMSESPTMPLKPDGTAFTIAPVGEWRLVTNFAQFTQSFGEISAGNRDLAISARGFFANGGSLLWVAGPALVHSRARADFEWFIREGFVGAMLAGNAVAVHDIEAAIFGTTLGMDGAGRPTSGGHGLHMRAINAVRAAGSIEAAVADGLIPSGIMHALVTTGTPYVLAGSIRDDGPLPGVLTDALAAQDAMREHSVRATGAVLVATALHAIAVGNMLPAFHTHNAEGRPEPLLTICVDQTEFVVTKLKDRGTHQAFGVVTNAQDFMHVLRHFVEARCSRN